MANCHEEMLLKHAQETRPVERKKVSLVDSAVMKILGPNKILYGMCVETVTPIGRIGKEKSLLLRVSMYF